MATTMKTMGRPKLDHPRSETVRVRAQASEVRAWRRAAKKADMTLSAWLRALANAAAGHEPKRGR